MELVERCEMLKALLIFSKEVKAFESYKSFQHASGFAVLWSDKGNSHELNDEFPEISYMAKLIDFRKKEE